ncbi:MAG: TerC family protein, partial [Candidatus Competibacteraceae bacterium]|nr:TerC family protein [Candidatus Competibacteraceae bacterium]
SGMVAIVISIGVMMIFAGKISRIIQKHPSLQILALAFLILIGFMLVLESLEMEIPKGYIYFAIFFTLGVELINMRIRKIKS